MINKNTDFALLRVEAIGDVSAEMREFLAQSAENYIDKRLGGCERLPASIIKKLEQYYTSPSFAGVMIQFLNRHVALERYLVVEPSAGDATISRLLPVGSISFDVWPRAEQVIKADFLALAIDHSGPVAVIGNPPFSAAVSFFNHAASQAEVIAMILPRTFRKDSVLSRLDRRFHLVGEIDVPADAFLRAGEPYDVPAVFQIWEKRDTLRPIAPRRTTHPDFRFGTSVGADFAIQRVGANAGRVHREFGRSGEAHLFVTVTAVRSAKHVEAIMKGLPLASVARNTAGNPSIAASEIVALYSDAVSSRWCRQVTTASSAYTLACRYRPTKRKMITQPAVYGAVQRMRTISDGGRCARMSS
ncbi:MULTISPECIES: hypothetical protein [Sphingomonas]|uniref:Uncharacterized protein n=1 Tax=Sphingomonas molluscorum TaxID=418184 RepID=A0ABU8Q4N9_9SPHN|nr:hypothetical protein [Sphingomonas sp. JUb134]MBM7406229.1 hypothetical protein [Sphingomonas sp. JUb134]